MPVVIDGVPVRPGDLIHGDANGVTTIPLSIADQVSVGAAQVRAAEAEVMGYIKSPDFTVEGFMQFRNPKH